MGVCVCLGITCVFYVIIKISAFCFSGPVIVIGVLFRRIILLMCFSNIFCFFIGLGWH